VGVEQVRIHAAAAVEFLLAADRLEQVAQDQIGVVAVVETRPQVDFPSHAPAGGRVAAMDERLAGGLEQTGVA